MSDKSKQEDMDDRELERQLANLTLVALHPDFVDELVRDRDQVLKTDQNAQEPHIHWKRLIPLSLAACFVMVSYVSFRIGDVTSKQLAENAQENSPSDVIGPPAKPTLEQSIVPVSAEGYLIRTSSGGIIDSEDGPVEELNLEYQDRYYWHDPATNTHIRFFTPSKERVLVPVITN